MDAQPTTTQPHKSVAPVAVFAYARPMHLAQTIESLLSNSQASETDVIVFCDAAKSPAQTAAAAEVRRYVDSITGFASLRAVHRADD